MEKSLVLKFHRRFKSPPDIVSSAPGRINIIGEHTDYNQGYVLPAAINRRISFLASSRSDKKVRLWSENFKKRDEFSLDGLTFSEENKWANYVKGVFWALKNEGFDLKGINGLVWGDIPLEAGLSSSAALEVSVVVGLNKLFRLKLQPLRMALLAQKAENDFVGVKCGLMDQFISIFGRKNKALFLNCQSLRHNLSPVRLERAGLRILVYNTGVRRKLASSEYNKRRNETSRALEFLKKYGVKNYRQNALSLLEKKKDEMDETLFKRARHVFSENRRVRKAVEALEKNNFRLLGELLFQSHQSLRDDYQVSCPELDLLYEVGQGFTGCLGARLVGAGFGGSGIALVEKERISAFKKKLLEEAEKRGFVSPEFYVFEVGEGATARFLQ